MFVSCGIVTLNCNNWICRTLQEVLYSLALQLSSVGAHSEAFSIYEILIYSEKAICNTLHEKILYILIAGQLLENAFVVVKVCFEFLNSVFYTICYHSEKSDILLHLFTGQCEISLTRSCSKVFRSIHKIRGCKLNKWCTGSYSQFWLQYWSGKEIPRWLIRYSAVRNVYMPDLM